MSELNSSQDSKISKSPTFVRSFGRIKSRKLSDHKQNIFSNSLQKYLLDEERDAAFLNHKNLVLEIGFGFGDFTFEFAKNNSDVNLIACETHINGIVNLLGKLDAEPLENIRIYKEDARILIQNLPDNIFDKVHILFPDPWPKFKHYKRRLINSEFLDLLSKKIKKSGKLIIATDHNSYKEWILNATISRSDFFWIAQKPQDWEEFPQDWTYTKYQKKAAREGRESAYLEFHKV